MTMRSGFPVYAVFAVLSALGCSGHTPPPAPASPTKPATTQASFPHSPEISRELMGYVVISDGARLADELTSNHDGDTVLQQGRLLQLFGLQPDVARAVDLKRPLAVALLNPSLLATNGVQPYLAMIPVRSKQAVEAILVARGVPFERTQWGFSLPSGRARMYIGFVGDYAAVAWRPELLDAAVHILKPRMERKKEAPIFVHVDADNLYEAYGPQLTALFSQLTNSAGAEAGDPQRAYAMRSLREAARYFASVKDVELLADIDSGGLTFTLRADGKTGGPFSGYVLQQQPGPAWGVQFLPRDSVLAFATHASPLGRAQELDASLDYVAEAAPHRQVGSVEKERMRKSLERAAESTNGELVYAIWPGRDGGLGLGGAYRINNTVEARAAVAHVYQALAPELGGMVMRALGFDTARLADLVHVTRRTIRLGLPEDKSNAKIEATEADLVELSVKWPKQAQAEKQLFESLFGPKLTLATAFVDDKALFAVGADYRERLDALIRTAHGAPQASLGDEPAFAEALNYKPGSRVSLVYVETAAMAGFVAGLVRQSPSFDEEQQRMVLRLLSQVGHGAIVSTTNANGQRYELTTHVPQSAIAGVPRLNAALWRIALTPLVNPPMLPPMPVPPPQLTPAVNQQSERPSHTM
jgi:hypothetical protein